MNQARFSQEYKNHYFNVLQQNRNNQLLYIGIIIDKLYSKPTYKNGIFKIQFSFGSKLLHTINNNKPIFDSLIRSFFFFPKVDSSLLSM